MSEAAKPIEAQGDVDTLRQHAICKTVAEILYDLGLLEREEPTHRRGVPRRVMHSSVPLSAVVNQALGEEGITVDELREYGLLTRHASPQIAVSAIIDGAKIDTHGRKTAWARG